MSVYHLNKPLGGHIIQNTLKADVSFEGIALHSGQPVSLRIAPGKPGTGIVFIRTDLAEPNEIPALWNNVARQPFATVIKNDQGASVSTIEHIMAALAAATIDNARLYVSGPEAPVLDGSSLPFLRAIQQAGTIEQSLARSYCIVLKPVRIESEWGCVELSPSSSFILDVESTFAQREGMEPQQLLFRFYQDDFAEQIAPARTFGFWEDVEKLRACGFAKGGSLENAVVVKDGAVLNPDGLRFANECVRHKILDAIGDLYLAGGPFIGRYVARNGGHELNNRLLQALFKDPTAYRWDKLESVSTPSWEPRMRSMMPAFGL